MWTGLASGSLKTRWSPSLTMSVPSGREVPTPVNITDMRSYWALVNQVAPFYSVNAHLQPFRELLKKKSTWYWDGVLQKLFEESRERISNSVLKGITRYDKDRWTAVCPDWSKQGVGFFMSQQYCQCLEITSTCCVDGWQVCMVGSSFNSPA